MAAGGHSSRAEEKVNLKLWRDFLQNLTERELVKRPSYSYNATYSNQCLSADFAADLKAQAQYPDLRFGGLAINSPDQKQKVVRSDKSKSASQWTLEMFAKYIDFKTSVSKFRFPDSTTVPDVLQDIMDQYHYVLQLYGQTLAEMSKGFAKESDVRILINCMLVRMCSVKSIRMTTEDKFSMPGLPNCIFDYLLLTPSGIPFCCIETKRPASLNADAFAQTTVELFNLQQIAAHKGMNTELKPVFAILTDGQRFVFIQLVGKQLSLEHGSATCKLYVVTLEKDPDFALVMKRMAFIIETSLEK